MLSAGYFDFRWSWYRPILNRGEAIASRCRVDVRRLPVRYTGEDGKEYVPYAVRSETSKIIYTAMRHLQEYSVRYMINGEKVSAHQLPNMNPVARMMVKHLRSRYPHLPSMLLHHWCADEKGGLALFEMWQSMWRQSWKQDQADNAPWVAAVNILILKMIRESIGQLPKEHEAHTDHIMVCVAGGLFNWALRNFLKQHVEGAVEVTRIATYEAAMVPVTPLAFLYRQPNDSLLGDDRFVIMAYGLEPDIVPRMRQLRAKVELKHEAGILPLLAKDPMGEHMLRRSWARLALWELAEKTGQGIWMQWVLNAKKLDQLLAKPELLADAAVKLLESSADHPLAAWVLAKRNPKLKADKAPWLKDDRVLNAFRVFEEDVGVECARRQAEKTWLDRRVDLAGKGRSAEVDSALLAAWKEGKLVYFQDSEQSLHSGGSLSSSQACLRIDWADYLARMCAAHVDFKVFLNASFMPGILTIIERQAQVFLDTLNASGCLLRGDVSVLIKVGSDIREAMNQFYRDAVESDGKGKVPSASMCMAMLGAWTVVEHQHREMGDFRLASGLSLAQADAGISHDSGIKKLIELRDYDANLTGLGGVRIDVVDSGTGKNVPVLFNQGFALTEAVMTEYLSLAKNRMHVKQFSRERNKATSIFASYRLLGDVFDLVVITPRNERENMMLFVKVGTPNLNGSSIDLYELLDPSTAASELIRHELLTSWG